MLGHQTDEATKVIHRDADVLAEEISALVELSGFRIDQRIIRNRIHLSFDNLIDTRDAFDDRAHILRETSQRVAVLDLSWLAVGVLSSFGKQTFGDRG